MTLLVTGEVDRIQEREAGLPGNTWIEKTIVVRDWGQTLFVTVGRQMDEDGAVPSVGERVALDVSVRSYVSKKTGEAGHGYTAHRRNSEAEAVLFGSSALRAAN